MQALIYLGLQQKTLEDRPKPTVQVPSDAIIKATKTTIFGTDLHILKGDVATSRPRVEVPAHAKGLNRRT